MLWLRFYFEPATGAIPIIAREVGRYPDSGVAESIKDINVSTQVSWRVWNGL
jgi:hypothetical protein